jgi:nucleoside diphosphate kinase
MFQLTREEWGNLKSQFVTSSWGGIRKPPYAFTEHGVAMLSSVLHSRRAIAMNVEIIRAFVRMRRMVGEHADLAARLNRLEKDYSVKFKVVFDAIRQLMLPPSEIPRKRIGFRGG